jgi:predicted permease
VPIDEANARVLTLAARLKGGSDEGAAFAREANWSMFAMPFTEFVAGDSRRPMLVLLGAVGFVLLIACANIAGLMVARTTSRSREIAVRSALGAQRWQLLRELLTESLLLAGGGMLGGVLVAAAGMRLLLVSAPEGAVVGLVPRLDVGVLAFALAAALISAALFALAPAWQISRSAVFEQLKASGRSATGGRGRQRLRAALVVAETALAVLLLIGAGLLIRSFSRIQEVSPGFDPHGVVTGGVALPATRYEEPARRETFYRTLIERLEASPGVLSAAAAVSLPFVGSDNSASFQVEGVALGPGDPGPHGRSRYVTPEYFATLRIPLKRGRTFTPDDRLGAAPVVVIDQNLAARYWPGQDPIGKRMRQGQAGSWSTIVGVVGHVLHNELVGETDKGTFYRPFYQRPNFDASVVIRVRSDIAGSMGVIAQAVAAVDNSLPVQRVTSLDERVAASLAPRRFAMRVLSFFAVVALILAALGLYGVISYSVAQRTQEIGIRVALGGTPGSVVRSVLAQGIGLAAAGLGVGLVAAIAAGRVLSGQLYQVSAFDPVTLGVMVPVLLAAAVFASWLPARAASRVDPLVALRQE